MGAKIPGGVQLWPIGADTAKATIYSRLKMSEPGPGYYHFPIGVDEEYFIQLTAEKLVTRYVKGYPRLEWVKVGPRNEALDCEVYCLAAAIRAGMARIDWDGLEKSMEADGERKERKPAGPARSQGGGWLGNRGQKWL